MCYSSGNKLCLCVATLSNLWDLPPHLGFSLLGDRIPHWALVIITREHGAPMYKIRGQPLAALLCFSPSETPQAGPEGVVSARPHASVSCLCSQGHFHHCRRITGLDSLSTNQGPEHRGRMGHHPRHPRQKPGTFTVGTDAWLHLQPSPVPGILLVASCPCVTLS